jgi:PIN domain nuclease of toxin-antitoxin system
LRAAIEDGASEIYLSAASVWEIAVKRAIGKLRFDQPIVAAVMALGFEILPVTGAHAEHAGGLPRHHNDPFDRPADRASHARRHGSRNANRLMRPYGVAVLGFS